MRQGSSAHDPSRAELDRVLASETFRNAEGLRRLLAYLGQKSLDHPTEDLKEYTIGVEACGKPESYDPQKDAAVRVQVSRLRQKLAEYQQGEGLGDPMVIEIPKGRFALVFHEQPHGLAPASPLQPERRPEPSMETPTRRPGRLHLALAGTCCLLACFAVWTFLLSRKVAGLEKRLAAPHPDEPASLWRPFFAHNAQNVIVFGSPAFFASTKYKLFVRLYGLADANAAHSSPAFRDLDERLGGLQGPRYDYASMGDAVAAQRLTAALGSAGLSFRAVPAHLAAWDSLQDANIIFIGAPRMNTLLRRLPVRRDFEVGDDSFVHNRNPQPGEQKVYPTTSNRDAVSYAVVSASAGLKPEREILLITAHGTPGTMGAVDFLTSREGAATIRRQLKLESGQHKHFQMLLRIYADNDVPVKSEYVTHHVTP